MEEHGLTQHVNVPTHTQGNSNDILDLVLTNRPYLIKKLSVVDGVADHNTILIYINISPKRKCRPKRNFLLEIKLTMLAFWNTWITLKTSILC